MIPPMNGIRFAVGFVAGILDGLAMIHLRDLVISHTVTPDGHFFDGFDLSADWFIAR